MAGKNISKSHNDKKNQTFDTESCQTILEVSKELYNDELERTKQIESKSAIALTFIGIIITLLLSSIVNAESTLLINLKINTIFFCIDIAIMGGFVISIIHLLDSITTSDFQQVKIDEIVNVEDATSNPAQVKINIAATYQKIVNHNMAVINEKAEKYKKGINLAKCSFILFSINFLIQEVIRYAT